ncbi:MAG TPA: cysteine--tRNA ligase [Anaerolineae bacterium]|nr:cysteine--tRNA ligase [Anaerolineae bacterium]HPL28211.1 cysteine--tRNA ligase [Anaerolineae bacterium]
MALQIYNTLTRQKELFTPLHEGQVMMYVCGPTVYQDTHIGHGKTYVNFDVVVRYLRYLGYRVRYVQNITDVGHILDSGEDRILKGAAREHIQPMELVERYTRRYFEDMDALNVMRPDISPRASGHITEQIALVERLLARGHAYVVNGSVYFDVASWPTYGKLSGRRVEDLLEGTRIEVNPEKRHPADFALWKRAEPGHIMQWPSPWGLGYPGWHVECSAMSTKYLGQPFDIHGGGMDNKFPHHEAEVAQSEAAYDLDFARIWMHNGMVMVGGEEMHKSLGNFWTLRQAFERWSPMAVRFFIVSSHYRSPLDFSEASVDASARGLERLWGGVRAVRERLSTASSGPADDDVTALLEDHEARFLAAMDDDFNASGAVGVLFDLVRATNGLLAAPEAPAQETLEAIDRTYRTLGGEILGVVPDSFPEQGAGALADELVALLLSTRQDLRAAKQFALADAIRDRLTALGIVLEDTPHGTRWRRTT